MSRDHRSIRRAAVAALIALLTGIAPGDARAQAGSGIVRVAPSGADAEGCGGIGNPCATLQYAVDAFALDAEGILLLAGGTYTSSAPREVVRVTGRRLTIEGGHSLAFDVADPLANPVVIDGQGLRRGVTVDPAPATAGTALLLRNVTVQNGRAPQEIGVNVLSSFGGGLDAFGATIELVDVRFVDNVAQGLPAADALPGDGAGGGCSIRGSQAILNRVAFTGNTARGGDGTASAYRGGLGVGGGLFSYLSTVALVDVDAETNTARGGDAPSSVGAVGAQRADGLGGFWALILASGAASGLSARANVAEGGIASGVGGLGLGGAIMVEGTPTPVSLSRVHLHGNAARGAVATGPSSQGGLGGGGGLFATDSVVEVSASTLLANVAEGADGVSLGGDGAGGGVYLDSVNPTASSLTAVNVVVGRNHAIAGSGTTQGFAFGGGVFQQCPQLDCASPTAATSHTEFVHVTLADNAVSGATYNQGAALYVSPRATSSTRFSVVSGHQTPAVGLDRGEAVLSWGGTTFETTLWHDNTIKAFAAPGGSFDDSDPRAGSPDYVDANAEVPDYHILDTSAARDQYIGIATITDLDGDERSASEAFDLGADEYVVPEPSAVAAGASIVFALVGLRCGRQRRRTKTRS